MSLASGNIDLCINAGDILDLFHNAPPILVSTKGDRVQSQDILQQLPLYNRHYSSNLNIHSFFRDFYFLFFLLFPTTI